MSKTRFRFIANDFDILQVDFPKQTSKGLLVAIVPRVAQEWELV